MEESLSATLQGLKIGCSGVHWKPWFETIADLEMGISKFLPFRFLLPNRKNVWFLVCRFWWLKRSVKSFEDKYVSADLLPAATRLGALVYWTTIIPNWSIIKQLVLSQYAALLGSRSGLLHCDTMMDGRISAIRLKFDALGFDDIGIIRAMLPSSAHSFIAFRDACPSSQFKVERKRRTTRCRRSISMRYQ